MADEGEVKLAEARSALDASNKQADQTQAATLADLQERLDASTKLIEEHKLGAQRARDEADAARKSIAELERRIQELNLDHEQRVAASDSESSKQLVGQREAHESTVAAAAGASALADKEAELLSLRERTEALQKQADELETLRKHNEELQKHQAALEEAHAANASRHAEELSTLAAAHETALSQAHAEHAAEVAAGNDAAQERIKELEQALEQIRAELAGQEAKYAAQVAEVKAEHEQKVMDAFERARAEAGDNHSVDLQSLKEQSSKTIEQMRKSHADELAAVQAAHAAALSEADERRSSELKRIQIELSAAQGDLKKTRDTLAQLQGEKDASDARIRSLEAELASASDNAKRAASDSAAASSSETAALRSQIEQLEQQLSEIRNTHNQSQTAFVEQFEAIANQHAADKEALVQKHVDAIGKLTREHEEALVPFREKGLQDLDKLMDLQDKLDEAERARDSANKELALMASKVAATTPSTAASLLDSQGKENQEMSDLERLHAAHTEKIALLSNQHHEQLEKMLAERRSEHSELENVRRDLHNAKLEVQFLTQSQEDVDKLKQEIEQLEDRLRQATVAST